MVYFGFIIGALLGSMAVLVLLFYLSASCEDVSPGRTRLGKPGDFSGVSGVSAQGSLPHPSMARAAAVPELCDTVSGDTAAITGPPILT